MTGWIIVTVVALATNALSGTYTVYPSEAACLAVIGQQVDAKCIQMSGGMK